MFLRDRGWLSQIRVAVTVSIISSIRVFPRRKPIVSRRRVQVVGGFLESGSPEENSALKKLAEKTPEAPSTEELASQGIAFASKL